MSQNPIILPTTGTVSGLQLVQDANAALDTLNTKWSGSSPPSSPEQYQDWLDTSTSPPTLRIYDGSQWVAIGQIDTTNHVFVPTGLTPSGAVMPFAGATAPSGWLLCYGQAISRTTYAALFAAVGTTYGAGDGSTTFNLPDMRGRVAAGVDNMGGSAAGRLTGNSGMAGVTLGAAGGSELMQSHNHGINDPGHQHFTDAAFPIAEAVSGGGLNAGGTPDNKAINYVNSNTTGISIQNAGSGGSQNVQPTMVLNYIIKL